MGIKPIYPGQRPDWQHIADLRREVLALEGGGDYLPLTGGTISGQLILDGHVQTEWNKPILDVRPEWNNSGMAGEGVTVDATNIASRSDSTLFQGKVGGALSWRVRQGGLVQHYGATPGIDLIGTGGGWDYASIQLIADLATDKFWRIRHRQAEAHEFQIACDDGSGEKKIIRLTMAGLMRLFHKLLIESGTLTDPTDHLAITGTWNDAADTFRAIYANITNTASAAASRVLDLAVGGTSKFSVDVNGNVTAAGRIVGAAVPAARVYNNANITIPHATYTALTFNSERFDTDDIHSTSTNTSRLTCKTAGVYVISGSVPWVSNNIGQRQVGIRLNGTTYLAIQAMAVTSAAVRYHQVSTIWQLAVNDYVELVVFQDSGGNLDVSSGTVLPEFAMAWVSA